LRHSGPIWETGNTTGGSKNGKGVAHPLVWSGRLPTTRALDIARKAA